MAFRALFVPESSGRSLGPEGRKTASGSLCMGSFPAAKSLREAGTEKAPGEPSRVISGRSELLLDRRAGAARVAQN